jgi:hypothetical protein
MFGEDEISFIKLEILLFGDDLPIECAAIKDIDGFFLDGAMNDVVS